jgi:hypothetical protein
MAAEPEADGHPVWFRPRKLRGCQGDRGAGHHNRLRRVESHENEKNGVYTAAQIKAAAAALDPVISANDPVYRPFFDLNEVAR